MILDCIALDVNVLICLLVIANALDLGSHWGDIARNT